MPAQLPPREAVTALQADVRFAAAVRATAAGVVDLYQRNPILNRLLNDRARLLFGILVVDLHFAEEGRGARGFTASQAREACVANGICSAGRATAMIALLLFAGYLEALPPAADRRERRFGVTAKLLAVHAERWRRMFAAIALVRPEGEVVLAAMARPDFTRVLVHILAEEFRAGLRVVLHSAPELVLFGERNSGLLILFSLVAAGAEDDTMPPSRAVPVSISGVARRFGASRAHVLKLMRDAAAAGLIHLDSGEGHRVTLSPDLTRALRDFFATMFLYLGSRGLAAVEAMDPTAPG